MSNFDNMRVVVMAKTWLNLSWGTIETPIYGTVKFSENNRVSVEPDKNKIKIWYRKYSLETKAFDFSDVMTLESFRRGRPETLDTLVVAPIEGATQQIEDLTQRVVDLEQKLSVLANMVNDKFDIANSPINPNKL
jgi:hypothetical protein